MTLTEAGAGTLMRTRGRPLFSFHITSGHILAGQISYSLYVVDISLSDIQCYIQCHRAAGAYLA